MFNNIYKFKRGIKISYENDKKNKYLINGIENRIEQIIGNLLDNSISFSKKGGNIFVNISNNSNKNNQQNIEINCYKNMIDKYELLIDKLIDSNNKSVDAFGKQLKRIANKKE